MSDMLTTQEVADRIRVHPVTLARWRAAGTGPAFVRVGRSIRYPAAELDAWLARRAA